MPKKVNEDLKTESGIYKSKYRNNLKYDTETVASIRVRVPKDWKPVIQAYVEESSEYSSMNEMFVELIKKEIGVERLENNK